ncbi:MAG: hypothetical protein ACC707_05130 [Thiohalomonadales bacterium]
MRHAPMDCKLFSIFRCLTIFLACYISGAPYTLADSIDVRRNILQDKLKLLSYAPGNDYYPIPISINTKYYSGAGSTQLLVISEIPYTAFKAFLSQDKWCDALILQIHIKACIQKSARILDVYLGSNDYAEPEDVFRFEYTLTKQTIHANYLYIAMSAQEGPLFSRDYRISLEIVPTADGKSLLNFELSAYFGFFTRAAIQAYLLTIGRNKVGFSILATDKVGQPVFQKGTKGILERNAMRYLLAFFAYLEVNPDQERDKQWLDKSLRRWHHYTEVFREQLYEIDLEAYLVQKKAEYQNQLDLLNGVKKEEWPGD